MLCALCKENPANKKNTHFLTDAIIRTCLNEDGSNTREKGFYFDVSTGKIFTDFNFQRSTSTDTIQKELGREPNEEEIEKAKIIPFSVDYVFCSKCEDRFTEIENLFIKKFLSEFREKNINNTSSFETFDYKTIRMFFILQVWRTSVCTQTFKLASETEEHLRRIIKEDLQDELNKYLLNITYLSTVGGAKEYTTNFVGYASGRNPYVIFMNDFVIQFCEPVMYYQFINLYGINHPMSFGLFNNFKEKKFYIKVINDIKRKQILTAIINDIRVKPLINSFANSFIDEWTKRYNQSPTEILTQKFIQGLVDWKDIPLVQQLSRERVTNYIDEFFKNNKP